VIAGELPGEKPPGERLEQLHQPSELAFGYERTRVPSPAESKIHVPSTGYGPSTM
jgi:hypothetical protein